ncbi:glycosyltransferase family 9 protein [bacterium]|jgi:ADP-heptose:LPS heptosyltransferase|nr:glycosyltransferase family 9 protein [bacterium]
MTPLINRLLVVRPDALGDAVLCLPLLATLKRQFPDAELTVLASAYTRPFFEASDVVDEVIEDRRSIGKAKGLVGFFRYAKWLKAQSYDVVILPYSDDYLAWLMWFARIPIRIGDSNRMAYRAAFTHGAPQAVRNLNRHVAEQNIDLLRTWLPDIDSVDVVSVTVPESARQEAHFFLTEKGWRGRRLIGIHPTTGGHNRAWGAERYAVLAKQMVRDLSATVILTGYGAADNKVCKEIVDQAGEGVINLCGLTSLTQLMGVVSQCELFVGTDTGPVHMAASIGISILGLAPTKFVKASHWGPWGVPSRLLGDPRPCPLVCNPLKCSAPHCVAAIIPDRALASAKDLLDSPGTWEQARQGLLRRAHHVGVLVRCSEIDHGESRRVIEELEDRGYRYTVINDRWFIPSLIRRLAVADFTVIHGFSRMGWKWSLIRSLVAPFVYAPPIVIEHSKYIRSEQSLLHYYDTQMEKQT